MPILEFHQYTTGCHQRLCHLHQDYFGLLQISPTPKDSLHLTATQHQPNYQSLIPLAVGLSLADHDKERSFSEVVLYTFEWVPLCNERSYFIPTVDIFQDLVHGVQGNFVAVDLGTPQQKVVGNLSIDDITCHLCLQVFNLTLEPIFPNGSVQLVLKTMIVIQVALNRYEGIPRIYINRERMMLRANLGPLESNLPPSSRYVR